MRKIIIVLAILAITIAAAYWLKFYQNKNLPKSDLLQTPAQSPSPNILDEALKNALNLYSQKRAEGIDFGNGPCLGTIAPDWVLDISHDPRQPVDNLPENQCADFRGGRAHHFIELDPEGKLIKIY